MEVARRWCLTSHYARGVHLSEGPSDAHQSSPPSASEATTRWPPQHLPNHPPLTHGSADLARGPLPPAGHGAVRRSAPWWPSRWRWFTARNVGAVLQSTQSSNTESESELEPARGAAELPQLRPAGNYTAQKYTRYVDVCNCNLAVYFAVVLMAGLLALMNFRPNPLLYFFQFRVIDTCFSRLKCVMCI